MAIFEKNYRAAAVTELERSVRAIEERDKEAQTKQQDGDLYADVLANVNFAVKIRLITEANAANYRLRMAQAQAKNKEREHLERTETRDIVDDFENSRERAERLSHEEFTARIREQRESDSSTPADRTGSVSSKSGDAQEKEK